MIYQFDKRGGLSENKLAILGQSFSKKIGKTFHPSGSSLYILRKVKPNDYQIRENARCNFEKYQNGMLLRINDAQINYYSPLLSENIKAVIIERGKEKIWPISLTFLLFILGVSKEILRNYWLLSRGFYHERFQLVIETRDEIFHFDAHDCCFRKETKYFLENALNQKLEIKESQE